jgi:diguanylate cyclase (GGDEF)-like protein
MLLACRILLISGLGLSGIVASLDRARAFHFLISAIESAAIRHGLGDNTHSSAETGQEDRFWAPRSHLLLTDSDLAKSDPLKERGAVAQGPNARDVSNGSLKLADIQDPEGSNGLMLQSGSEPMPRSSLEPDTDGGTASPQQPWSASSVAPNDDLPNTMLALLTSPKISIAVGLLLGFLFGIVVSIWSASFTRKTLIKLKNHIAKIHDSGVLAEISDRRLLKSRNEAGALARSLNDMVRDVGRAQRTIVDRLELDVQKQLQRLSAAVNNISQGLAMLDPERRLIICNEKYIRMYCLPPKLTMPGTPVKEILQYRAALGFAPDDETDLEDHAAAINDRNRWNKIRELRDGRSIAITHTPLPDGGSVTTHEDVTERCKIEAAIAHLAHHDPLTNLLNRARFAEEMSKGQERLRDGGSFALFYVDVDHFKKVNEQMGHPLGDLLLQGIASRLRECASPNDVVARIGDDEFVIIHFGEVGCLNPEELASGIIRSVKRPHEIEARKVFVGATVGVTIAPDHGIDTDRLLRNAEIALSCAKRAGRGVFRVYDPYMGLAGRAQHNLEFNLKRALASDEFELFYQPIIRLKDGRVSAFEALLRWHHPERGILHAEEFVPVAEELGLIGDIGEWVLRQACGEAHHWPADVPVSVNISPIQLKARSIERDVMARLNITGLPASRLQLEINEAALIDRADRTIAGLQQLRDCGVKIGIDNFGTGHWSLSYLNHFPVDNVKIDRTLVKDAGRSKGSLAITRAANSLVKSLGLTMIADGVETQDQLEFLSAEGCDEVQGALLSMPCRASEIPELLSQFQKPAA